MQCLLHCDEFWLYCTRLHGVLSAVDPHLAAITEATDGPATGQAQHAEQDARTCDLARTIPITHELMAFAAHFRQIPRRPKGQQKVEIASPAAEATLPSDPAREAVVAKSSAVPASEASVPSIGTDSASNGAAEAAVDNAVSASLAAATLTEIPSAQPSADPSASTASSKSKAAKKKKKPVSDKDDAFLDRLLVPTSAAGASVDPLEEEEKRKARNKKKKEKEREREKAAKAKEQEAPASAAASAPVLEGEQSAEPAALPATAEIPTVDANGVPLSNAQRKKLRRQAEAAAAAANGESKSSETPSASLAPPVAAAPIAPTHEPIVAQPTQGDSAAVDTADPVTTGFVPRKQARVHRVEDEDGWTTPMPKGALPADAPKKRAPPKVKAPAASSSSPALPADGASTLVHPTLLGVAPTAAPFMPAFPSLLRAFQTHRQGQQEDAQELLQILCENVQSEWTAWTGPWQRASHGPSPAAAPPAEEDWNEVGKGSKAIKVVSNLSFAPSPLSRLFCGRVRSQLSVATRTQDTMSFQPFFALHLDIDDEPTTAHARPLDDRTTTNATPKHKHRKPVQMSVERALERYMCPSEISGYKKKGAPQLLDAWGYPIGQATTKALHMHALDSHALPRILVLHLKRFEHSGHGVGGGFGQPRSMQKSSKHVRFHSRLAMPARYLSTATGAAAADSGVAYTLVGVVVHHGHSMAGGHYTAFVRDRPAERESQPADDHQKHQATKENKPTAAAQKAHPPTRSSYATSDTDEESGPGPAVRSRRDSDAAAAAQQQQREIWYHCDDARITPVPAHTVYAQCAYLLFYTLN